MPERPPSCGKPTALLTSFTAGSRKRARMDRSTWLSATLSTLSVVPRPPHCAPRRRLGGTGWHRHAPGAPVVEGCCSVRSQSPVAPSHSYLIVSDAVTECEIAPLVPVTTRVTLREAVEDVVCTPSVELPAPVTELGLKLAVAP